MFNSLWQILVITMPAFILGLAIRSYKDDKSLLDYINEVMEEGTKK